MAERCPDCAQFNPAGHKIRVWKGVPFRPLWYVECACGWEPEPLPSSGRYGRPTWELALFTGQVHQRKAMRG